VQRAGDRRITPGPVLLRFAHRDDGGASLVELAAPMLRALSEVSGETVNLGVPSPLGVEHLAQEETHHFVGGTNWVGRRVPYETTANGKVLRAFSADRPATGAKIRAQGYATAVDELEHGLAAMAAPVFGAEGVAIAALSISAPTFRLPPRRIAELVPELVRQAALLSERLGHHDDTEGAA
jgi:DNA-binding IclR family transcriptional regulator